MENADPIQILFNAVGKQLADPDVDIIALRRNLHELVRSGHVCAGPIAVRILCELLTNGKLCAEDWPLALDYSRIAFAATETAAVNDTIAEIASFRDYALHRFAMASESATAKQITTPIWLRKCDI